MSLLFQIDEGQPRFSDEVPFPQVNAHSRETAVPPRTETELARLRLNLATAAFDLGYSLGLSEPATQEIGTQLYTKMGGQYSELKDTRVVLDGVTVSALVSKSLVDSESTPQLEVPLARVIDIAHYRKGKEKQKEGKAYVAPKMDMTDEEVAEFFVPGKSDSEKLYNLRGLAQGLHSELVGSHVFNAKNDNIMRGLVVLLRSHAAFKTQIAPTDYASTDRSIEETMTRFIRHANPYIKAVVKRHASALSTQTMEDLVSEGRLGLLEAMKRFDLGTTSAQVRTYCTYRINGSALDAIRSNGNTIRPSRYDVSRLTEINDGLAAGQSIESIAENLGITAEMVHELRARMHRTNIVQLDNVMEKSRSWDIADSQVDVEDEAIKRLDEPSILEPIFETLPQHEQELVKMRFGLPPYDRAHTLGEIGNVMSFSESRASQVMTKIFGKLRLKLRLQQVREDTMIVSNTQVYSPEIKVSPVEVTDQPPDIET
jgi:RNA polymerase sigma factor (sigma-70 family)